MSLNVTDILDEVQDQSLAVLLDINLGVLGELLDGERVYGDEPQARAERISRLIDLANRGVMDVLETMSPPTYERLRSEFLRDIKTLPGFSEVMA